MHRPAKALIVILASLAVGACAGKIKVAVIPTPPSPEAAVVDPEVPLAESADIEVLPIQSLNMTDLAVVDPIPTVPAEPKRLDPIGCDVAAKVAETETDPKLAAYPISAGRTLHSYVEVRFSSLDVRSDYELDIGVRVLDLDTCTTEVIGVRKTYGTAMVRVPIKTKKGTIWKEQKHAVALLEAPPGWDIDVIRRAQGVEWNNWGTEFHINQPSRRVIIGVRWPHVPSHPVKGQLRITPVTYVPYSRELHLEPLITAGRRYLDQLANRAYDELRKAKVESAAFPGTLVANVRAIDTEFLTSLAAIEHMDPGEFALDPKWTADRIHVVIGANGDHTATYTCSGADACGLMQFTDRDGNGTYTMIRKRYPEADLIKSFTSGARDHLNSMKAAILLLDNNLAYFHNRLGDAEFARLLTNRTIRRELSMSAYNTGADRTMNVYLLALKKKAPEWTDVRGSCKKPTYRECLLTETKGYIAKGRYIGEYWLRDLLALKP